MKQKTKPVMHGPGLDMPALVQQAIGQKFELYSRHINANKVRTGRQLGLARRYLHGAGCYLQDDKGRQFLDFEAGNAVFAVGRNHPLVCNAIRDLLDVEPANWVARDTPALAAVLAQRLTALLPDELDKVTFTSTGSEAVEAAMKFARRATGRSKFLYLEGDFHGLSYGALSVTGGGSRLEIMGQGFGPMLPDCAAIPWGNIDALERALATGDVAALLLEPVQGASVAVLSGEFLRRAQDLCRAAGTLLIADEILTGLGRCGSFIRCDQYDVCPDIVLLAKALSGGVVPAGAMIVRNELHERIYRDKSAFVHGSTFGENDFGMAAGLATLAVIEQEQLIGNAGYQGHALMQGLMKLKQKYSMIEQVNGAGLLIGMQLGAPQSWLRQPAARVLSKKGLLGHFFAMLLVDRHQLITAAPTRNNVLRLHPPLCVGDQEIARCLAALDAAFADAHRFPDGVGLALMQRLLKAND